ncbi:aldo/keto reductase [Luteimicrobium sp. DT211]|uniref:aldo/keto reductase n=1 Tax=Luteimicrobium sp. DT211 TaxID=3393412 RepID=UPI003CE9AF81
MTDTTNHSPATGSAYELAGRPVARVGYGAMSLEHLAGDAASAVALLREAFDLGVDHVDTADFYGDSTANTFLRRALRPDDDVLVATKVGAVRDTSGSVPLRAAQRPGELRAAVHDNLRSLGQDRLDLVYLRRLDVRPGLVAEGDQVVPLDDQLAELVRLRDEGTIGAIGLSAVSRETLSAALPARIAAVQNAYSVLARESEDMLELCGREGVAWVPFFPLGSGFADLPQVTGQPEVTAVAARLGVTPGQVGLAWLLQHAPHVLLIPGTSSRAHLAENVAVAGLRLDDDAVTELDGLYDARFSGAAWSRAQREGSPSSAPGGTVAS